MAAPPLSSDLLGNAPINRIEQPKWVLGLHIDLAGFSVQDCTVIIGHTAGLALSGGLAAESAIPERRSRKSRRLRSAFFR